MEEKTETYLLTNKGIEKLDASKELSQRDLKSLRDVSDKEKKDDDKPKLSYKQQANYDDKHTKKNVQRDDNNNRPVQKQSNQDQFQRSYSGHGNQSVMDSQHDMMMSMGGTENKDYYNSKKDENYRTINDKLNEFLANLLNYEAFTEDKGILDIKSSVLYQSYAENIDLFSERFNEVFSEDLEANVDDLAITLIKDMNDLWKFLYFVISCIKN